MKKTRPFRSSRQPTPKDEFNLNKPMRLNRFIALCGIASRRRADYLIREGAVRVNGKAIHDLGTSVHPSRDKVFVNNKPVSAVQDRLYVMLNKPPYVMTTLSDPEGRPTVGDYAVKIKARLFPVGRLDWESEGLLILTNDGELAQKIMHPKHDIPKTYLVKLSGQPTEEQIGRLKRGVAIIGGRARALHVSKMKPRGSDKYDWLKVIIAEGRNRQVRKMFEKLGFDVKKLQRAAIGALQLGALKKGQMRVLGLEEIEKIFQLPKEMRIEERLPIKKKLAT